MGRRRGVTSYYELPQGLTLTWDRDWSVLVLIAPNDRANVRMRERSSSI